MSDDDSERPAGAPQGERHEITAAPGDGGERLDRVLARHLAGMSRSRLKQLVLEGNVARSGARVSDPSLRVKPGERFTIVVPPPIADRPAPQPMPLDIRYEDDHIIVIDKPAGLVVHPAPGNLDNTLVNALLAHCGDRLAGIGGVRRPGIVHRLDKGTTGLMVVAKSEQAHTRLVEAFAARLVHRAYRAIVWGVPAPASGEIAGNIGRSPRNRKKMAVVERGGKAALTRYRVLKPFRGNAALIECRLATGRTHQIRVHLAERGHPLIGDPLYGGGPSRRRAAALPPEARLQAAAFGRQALHAYLLGIAHPITAQPLEFTSDLPKDITDLLDTLERF